MREIKFRVWDSREQRMIYSGAEQNDYPFSWRIMSEGIIVSEHDGFEWIPLQPIILMQYTGVIDKNGKEIYEGDIVATMYSTGGIYSQGKVEFSTNYDIGCNGFEYGFNICGYHCQDEYLTNCMIAGDVEIIGNIYDNPELLKEEQK